MGKLGIHFRFSKIYVFQLPDIVGTGHVYKISIISIWSTTKDGQNATGESVEVTEEFMTKPLAPTKLSIGNKVVEIRFMHQ